jgi:hypothetical protein
VLNRQLKWNQSMSNLFSPPERTFVIGVPTTVFDEANMTQFADPNVNYPTKVLAKALCLEILKEHYATYKPVALDRTQPIVAVKYWVRNVLTLRTTLAVLASFKAWWQASNNLPTTFESNEGALDWLGPVLREVDANWINARVSAEQTHYQRSQSKRERRYQELYEAQLPNTSIAQAQEENS